MNEQKLARLLPNPYLDDTPQSRPMNGNFIIHDQAKQYQWHGECFLSVKSFYHGQAHYQVGHREYHVSDDSYLILNECTHYRLTIDTPKDTESFCVFFSPDFFKEICSEHSATDAQRLDMSYRNQGGVYLMERKYQQSGRVSAVLSLGRKSGLDNPMERDEFYHDLVNAILDQNSGSIREADRLSLKKKPTRLEIYQRLYCARDFIHDSFRQEVSLADIARVALLSENHLLRCFKEVFGMSPFRYISMLRIQEACRLIATSDKTISAIARTVGYSSMGNFSHYFKNLVGVAPSHYKLGDL